MTLSLLTADQITAPDRLTGEALSAWEAAVASLGARTLLPADLLSLEAGCRAWARWRALEDKIAEVSQTNVLAGELAKGRGGQLEVSALREAANAALQEWRQVAADLCVALSRGDHPDAMTDLFGDPVDMNRGRRGRPKFIAGIRERNKVRLLMALGWTNTRIAAAIGVTLPTLHKHFKRELSAREEMRDRLDARRFEIAWDGANTGSITSLREFNRMLEQSDLLNPSARHAAKKDAAPEAEEKVGKKEQIVRRAQQPRGGWAERLAGRGGVH